MLMWAQSAGFTSEKVLWFEFSLLFLAKILKETLFRFNNILGQKNNHILNLKSLLLTKAAFIWT